jgi:hypothetical protein
MSEPANNSPAPALLLGFLPAALVLVVLTFGGQRGPPRVVIWLLGAVTVTCCFGSSFLLFRRRTSWAIVGGIALLLMNGFITLFLGCVALLQGMKF